MKLRNIIGLLTGASLLFSSCSDDEPSKSSVSFDGGDQFVLESDGTIESFHPLLIDDAVGREIEVKILFDKPLAQNAVIEYSVGGTAVQNSTLEPVGDFEINGNGENISVAKGATEAVIVVQLYEDFEAEIEDSDDDGYYETIEITLESVISGPVRIAEQSTYVITVYEDDALLFLDWDAGSGTRGDVDMDLLLWLDGDYIGGSDSPGTDAEGIAIPAGFPDGTYGMSYTYYDGTSDDLEFEVEITNLSGTLNSTNQQLVFTGNYTLANINTYGDDTDPNYKGDPQIVQTMVKAGFNYTNVSAINEPVSGSRLKPTDQLKGMKGKIKQLTLPKSFSIND